ncbi:MAG TPA: hypothetical protein VIJ41_16195 [Candidatus Nanopelagicales bacterium]
MTTTETVPSATTTTCSPWCDPVVHDAWTRNASPFLSHVGGQGVLTSTQVGVWVERGDELTTAGWITGEAVVGLLGVPRTMTPEDARELAARLVMLADLAEAPPASA